MTVEIRVIGSSTDPYYSVYCVGKVMEDVDKANVVVATLEHLGKLVTVSADIAYDTPTVEYIIEDAKLKTILKLKGALNDLV